jgi:hypothetical protein
VLARLFQRLRAPGAQRSVLQVLPQRGVLNVVLQVAVGGARGVAHPRRDEDAHRDQPLRMHVEEAEDLRLRVAEAVPDGSGLERGAFDWSLRAARSRTSCPAPTRGARALRAGRALVDGLADRADRAVADDGQLRAHIHSGHEAVGRRAGFVHALIGEAQSLRLCCQRRAVRLPDFRARSAPGRWPSVARRPTG